MRREALALVEAGYRVTVIAPRDPDQSPQEMVAGVSVYRYAPRRSNTSVLGFAWEFIYSTVAAFGMSLHVWREEGFDAVHAHNPPDSLFAVGLFYRVPGKPFVFDHHDVSLELYLARTGSRGIGLFTAPFDFSSGARTGWRTTSSPQTSRSNAWP